MQAILQAHNNRDLNITDKALPAKRNTQGELFNDRDFSRRGYGERYPDGRTASDRINDPRGLYGDDRSYHRDLESSRDYRAEEALRERSSLHEDRQYGSDRNFDGRRKYMMNDNSSLRPDHLHNDRTHIVDEIRHDTKIYRSDERTDMDHRSKNYNSMRGSQYEVNERRRSGESFDRKQQRHEIDPCCMDKPFVININSDCAGPSKGRFVHKFVIKPQSNTPSQNYPQQDPYKTMTAYQSPSNSYLSRQHVGSSLYGAYY